MSGNPDHTRSLLKPYLIARDAQGQFRITLRETRYNGQGYPVVTTTLVDESFASANAARAHAKSHFGAAPGEFASK
jgi:hypothetical protein